MEVLFWGYALVKLIVSFLLRHITAVNRWDEHKKQSFQIKIWFKEMFLVEFDRPESPESEPFRLWASDYRDNIGISFSGRAHNHHPGDIHPQINHILVDVPYITYPTYFYDVMNLLVHTFSSLQLIHYFSGDWNQSSTHVGRREIFLKHRSWA